MKKAFLIIPFLASLYSCKETDTSDPPPSTMPTLEKDLNFTVIAVYSHDTACFTEGLFWYDNYLYESTGLEGKTSVQKKEIRTGSVIKRVNEKDKNIFGEGIALLDQEIFQLTWKNKVVNIYDASSFQKKRQAIWPLKEGWGLTTDQKQLIASDGSSNIYFINPQTIHVDSSISVLDKYGPKGNINELEYVNGFIYANIWQTNYIVKINITTRQIVGKADLSNILQKSGVVYPTEKLDVLNGIAYNPVNGHFYVTGKYWPCLIELQLE